MDEFNTNEMNGAGMGTGDIDRYVIPQTEKEAMQPTTSDEGDLVLGTVGAIVGGLLGVGVWMLIFHLGYIAVIGGMAIMAGTIGGYKFLGKEIGTKGLITCIVISAILVYAANYLSWSMEFYLEMQKTLPDFTFGEAFSRLGELTSLPEVHGEYIKDLVLGYVFTVVGAFSVLRKR